MGGTAPTTMKGELHMKSLIALVVTAIVLSALGDGPCRPEFA